MKLLWPGKCINFRNRADIPEGVQENKCVSETSKISKQKQDLAEKKKDTEILWLCSVEIL